MPSSQNVVDIVDSITDYNAMHDSQMKHLELIIGVISRITQNSFAMKGWAIGLVSAILIAAYHIGGWVYSAVALLPVFVFWGLDAYYLKLERLFRKHYDYIRSLTTSEWDKDPFAMKVEQHENSVQSWIRTCRSVSVIWFYAPIMIAVIGITMYSNSIQSNEEINTDGKESVLQLPLREGCDSSVTSSKQLGH